MADNGNHSLEQILESAILVSWADLMRGTEAGLIHIEYVWKQKCTARPRKYTGRRRKREASFSPPVRFSPSE